MAEKKSDPAETLLHLAIGYFIIGSILMLSIMAIVWLVSWVFA